VNELRQFFEQMKPLLRGDTDARSVERRLGPATPEDGLAFYRVLMERNAFKAMRELFPAVPAAAERHRPGMWAELVRAFVQEHPAGGRHPDGVGAGFASWLCARRAFHPDEPVPLSELADFHAAQLRAATAPDPCDDDDGFDRTIHVRLYTHPVPAIAQALLTGPTGAALPEASVTPLVIHRHRRDGGVRCFVPAPAALIALARRAGTPVPHAFDLVPGAAVEAALRGLVARGVLPARSRVITEETTT
jgi:hypothetical protein